MLKIEFRDKTPKRRTNPGSFTKHQDHKPDLKVDFGSYCGYCHSHDMFKQTYYEVDHFIPMDFLKKNNSIIKSTTYKNLVYSCRHCNNAKRNKWPSKSETIYFHENEGFIDPCDENYSKQFYRCERGRIYGETLLGKWMAKTFKFQVRERQIELIWQLRNIHLTIQELLKEQSKFRVNSGTWIKIDKQLFNSYRLYYEYDQELRNFQ